MKKKGEKKLVGVKEIARRANVAIATVDRVLHNRAGVSLKTKARINAIIKELNYKPNILARRLASKEILKFAVLIPFVSKETDYWDAPLAGIKQAEAEIATYGIEIDKYFFDQNDSRSFLAEAKKTMEKKYHGVLLAPMFTEESVSFVKECEKLNIPCVFINSDLPDISSLCYIGPDLYQAGTLAGRLCGCLIDEKANILIVNISEVDNHRHFLRKEKGFREYFEKYKRKNKLIRLDIKDTAEQVVSAEFKKALESNKIDLIFVANSRVFYVAEFLEKHKIKNIKLVGFEFLKKNVEYLEKEIIDFLICQKPIEQGYRGIMALYRHFVYNATIEKVHHMPIDIIAKENHQLYSN